MKKFVGLILAAALVLSLAACASKKKNEETKEQTDAPDTGEFPMAGGWTLNKEFGTISLDADTAEMLEKAKSGLVPVAFLGSQVVGGMNYIYLCLDGEKLVTVEVYADLEGNVTLSDEHEVTLPSAIGGELTFREDNLDGAMEYGGAYGAGLSEEVRTAFDKATDGLLEITHRPIALLGTQVVAGINYAFLCCTTAKEGQAPALSVVIVYADLNGGATVTSVNSFVG